MAILAIKANPMLYLQEKNHSSTVYDDNDIIMKKNIGLWIRIFVPLYLLMVWENSTETKRTSLFILLLF